MLENIPILSEYYTDISNYIFLLEKGGDQDHIVMRGIQRTNVTLRKTTDTTRMIRIGTDKKTKIGIPRETGTMKKKKKEKSMIEMKNIKIEMRNIPEMRNIRNQNTEMKKK